MMDWWYEYYRQSWLFGLTTTKVPQLRKEYPIVPDVNEKELASQLPDAQLPSQGSGEA